MGRGINPVLVIVMRDNVKCGGRVTQANRYLPLKDVVLYLSLVLSQKLDEYKHVFRD